MFSDFTMLNLDAIRKGIKAVLGTGAYFLIALSRRRKILISLACVYLAPKY